MIKKSCISLIIIILINSASFAQPDPIEWGRLSPTDLLINNYSLDTAATALILCDYGNLSIEVIDNQYKIVFKRFKRIKIFRKSAYSEANIELLYKRAENESILDIKAESINPLPSGDSQVSVLKEQDILEKEVDENWNKKIFAIPGVIEGSVIEYSYTLISFDFFNYRTWSFQGLIPCLWSELRAELSGVYNYMVLLHNINDSLYINEKTEGFKTIPDQVLSNTNISIPIRIKSIRGRYVMKDIPRLIQEPFMTCIEDYRKEVRFQLFTVSRPYSNQINIIQSWSDLIQRLSEETSFGKWIPKLPALNELVGQIVQGKSTPELRMRAIYDYIRTHFRWNGEFRVMARNTVDQVMKQMNGNSAELNLLMLQMLKIAGLQAVPVIISTRSHGIIQKDFPILNQFNHIICQVKTNSGTYLLDVTEPYRPYNLLATEDLNSTGLAIEGEKYRWIDISSSDATKRNSLITIKIDSSGNIHGDLIIHETGHFAHNRRASLASMKREKFIDYLMNFFTIDLIVDTFSISNQYEIESPLKMVVSFSAKNAIDFMFKKDLIYFDAMIFSSMRNNPFKELNRIYPVDFSYPYEESTALVMQVPKGYTFEELPLDEHFIVPDESAEFLFQVFHTTKVFQVKSSLKIKKANYPVAEYSDLKLLFDIMVQKNSEQVTAIRDR